jgi:hypothetical protein
VTLFLSAAKAEVSRSESLKEIGIKVKLFLSTLSYCSGIEVYFCLLPSKSGYWHQSKGSGIKVKLWY